MFNYEEILCALSDFRKSQSSSYIPPIHSFSFQKFYEKIFSLINYSRKHWSENFTKIIFFPNEFGPIEIILDPPLSSYTHYKDLTSP